ncbi:hypothetical protein FRE64_00160 [Euhalothece natronophila Z-M001]|uniref:Uncharacterized protein n=1 Tax=Euhalothece natronophila Z-M001 TaxID=522448 RepID=A0A5B8NHS6_9CHRO|nr:hormogonium polysaccharide biosynthesis protein HpsA [Euhalothece natronophila]QDZ38494.1 hypothetical protein FRE64_00160 [Euhalothece natronophila Z-M001]
MPLRSPRLLRQLWRSFKALAQAINRLLIKFFFFPLKKRIKTKAGFVLPTATLVLLVVSLLVGTLIIRTGQEAEEAISEQAQQEIFNAATPAVDRAKAKLEYLFRGDPRFPVGVPSEIFLNSMMLNDGEEVVAEDDDPYTFEGENRLDINDDGDDDNAWSYTTNNGQEIAYSINLLTESNGVNYQEEDALGDKADNLVVRSGPLAAASSSQAQRCAELSSLSLGDDDWFTITGSTVRKNFQIDAVATNNSDVNPVVSTIEVQQDRDLDFANKWGAWFRYDMEFTPGSDFNWNGALHTEGSLILNNNVSSTTKLFLVSAPESCFYTEEASEITMGQVIDDGGNIDYQGQLMKVNTNTNQDDDDDDNKVRIDLFPGPNEKPEGDTKDLELSPDNDSVDEYDENPSLYYLDSVRLISENESRARNPNDDSNTSIRDEAWDDEDISNRIFNSDTQQPYVDDTYRADDRWGPKPEYTEDLPPVTATNNGRQIQDEERLTNNPPAADAENAGLDGYWERRANAEGLRIIVGERLELGNTDGWDGSDDDLYPSDDNQPGKGPNNNDSEYDNLASVQSGVVYHWDEGNHDPDDPEPVACLALTSHQNGNDTEFDEISIDGTDFLVTNFFEGEGTNGWEFEFPDYFSSDINNSGSTLREALQNLAQFAGDPDGAFPPLQENGGNITHPYPELTMWGDFSNLRRAVDQLNGGSYDDLSLADKTTLQTATCNLGMLAYNVDFLRQNYEDEQLQDVEAILQELSTGDWTSVGKQLVNSIGDDNFSQGIIGRDGRVCTEEGTGLDENGNGCPTENPYDVEDETSDEYYTNYFSQFSVQDWINFAEDENSPIDAGAADDIGDVLEAYQDNLVNNPRAELFLTLQRDREHGFNTNSTFSEETDDFDPDTGIYTVPGALGQVEEGDEYIMDCDPNTDIFGFDFINSDRARFGLGNIICNAISEELEPRYPSLYYLFPTDDHDHDGDGTQPPSEPYINDEDNYISDDVNGNVTYQEISDDDIEDLALSPRDESDFTLPTAGSGVNKITLPDETELYVSFLEKAFYNRRENMTVRVLDIDLDLLRNDQVSGGDYWLPTGEDNSSIVYAFREDAVREDGIARPRNSDWSDCNDEEEITGFDMIEGDSGAGNNSDGCRMSFNNTQDPPLNDETGVSVKPVDSYPDLDRRPYGFRLRNGADISRPDPDDDPTGLSFITDQPVYIQGDFNEHEESEFDDENNDFYDRSDLNEDFATPSGESWRTAEIIADGITLLSESENFEEVDPDGNNDTPAPTGPLEVNAILVSGFEPSFPRKYNGGIHNFPRLLDNWSQEEITIRGSFIQLNFSIYSTGPWSQQNQDPDDVESLEDANEGNNLRHHYGFPQRNWGYDVGLQYNPPGPVAERFVTPSNARTETYRELSVDDPYIRNLLDAINAEE